MKFWPWRRPASPSSPAKISDETEPSPRENGAAFVVVKVGGSLFDLPDLAERLRTVRERRPRHVMAFVPGGGKTADAVREYQRIHGISDEVAHLMAMQAMDANVVLIAAMWERFLPGHEAWVPFALAAIHEHVRPPDVCIWGPTALRDDDAMRAAIDALPATWDVTSDSISAVVAQHVGASELILLKSRPAPHPATRAEAVRDLGVDPMFLSTAKNLPRVTWIDLRADPSHETELT